MLKFIVMCSAAINLAFAGDRFSEADKKKFIDDIKQEVAEHKVENKGKIDLQIIKPEFEDQLDIYVEQEKVHREEALLIRQHFEEFAKNPQNTGEKTEQNFYNFIHSEFNELNKKPIVKIKEGDVCNSMSCQEKLTCAADPLDAQLPNQSCKTNKDCTSGDCQEEGGKKFCAKTQRCYKPLSLGQSCLSNPVCGQGTCLSYNSQTSGIGECSTNKNSCIKNSDCCSNLCSSGFCKENMVCKDCVNNGGSPQRGQKCCEGLYINRKGFCVPDVPPTVIPQVNNSALRKIFLVIADFFVPLAQADGGSQKSVPISTVIKNNPGEYKDFKAKSAKNDDIKMKAPVLEFKKTSNFETCDMRFKDDFYNFLKEQKLFDYQIAMLGFDFVVSGDSRADYWMKNGKDPTSSIHGRLRKIAIENKKVREQTNAKIDEINTRLTCLCLDAQGLAKIKSEEKKIFFEKNCPDEYRLAMDQSKNLQLNKESDDGDASGVKGKRLLTVWTSNLASFNAILTTNNTNAFSAINEVSKWSTENAKWTETKDIDYPLFKYSVKDGGANLTVLGGLVGALLAAGVIAILGGFSYGSILSAWAMAGIITASAATGASGIWLIASLKGAWITKRPEIIDRDPRGYMCGKKQRCTEFSRVLRQPYNDICRIHASANACIKDFVVVNQNNESRHIVDPWIPAGVPQNTIITRASKLNYAEKLEKGFQEAKDAMIEAKPSEEIVSNSYQTNVFINEKILGKYLPSLGKSLDSNYFMNEEKIKVIKEAAKKFAVSEKFLEEDDPENLEKFANYVYTYHFIWPKLSRSQEISYPTVGLTTYLSVMANEVAAQMAVGNAKAVKMFSDLSVKHYKDYINTLKIYSDLPINQNQEIKNKLDVELQKAQQELDALVVMNALSSNQELDDQLMKMNASFIASNAKLAGVNGNVLLSKDQASYLRSLGVLRKARKEQLKDLENYKKEMSTNEEMERANQLTNASRKFNNKFSTGDGAIGSGFGGSSANSSENSSGEETALSKATPTLEKNRIDGINGTGALYGFGSGAGSSRGSDKDSKSSSGNGDDDSNSQANNGQAGISEEERNRLAEAIEARDKAYKDKYNTKEGSSLFEQVTNAYIRNYDKVLTKKKGKDVEQN